MTNAEGAEVLRRAASQNGQFIVSTANLAVRRAAWNTDATHAALSREQRTGLVSDRPRLRNGYIEPRSSLSLDCLFNEPTVSGLAIQVEARRIVTLRPPSPEYGGGHASDEVEVEEGAF